MLTYPGDPRGNPPQHVALSSFTTSAAPFTVDGPHPPGPTQPNPSFAVSAAPSLNAAGGWGDRSLMEAPARFMAPEAASAPSLGYTGEVFDTAPYGIYSDYHFGNFVDPHPLRSESSELISEKRPGTCGESLEAASNGFGRSSHCQQQNASASKLLDGTGAECLGCYHPRPVPNQDPSGSATSLFSGAHAVPVNSLTSESVPGNVSSQAAQAEKNAFTQILTKEGKEHSHYHPDAEESRLQMSDSSSRNQAIFIELMHKLSVVLLSTCNGGSSLQEYEKENLKSVIRNLKAVSSKGGKAALKGDDCLRNSSQISCLRNNFLVEIPEHSVVEKTDSEINTYFSQALPKLPEDKMLDDSDVSQMSIYKKLWIEAEASACKLKYELQVACMKLATKKGHNNTETVSADPAPLEVLESCIDNQNKCKEQKEASKESHAVEDGVLVGLSIVKSCTDNITSLSLESNKPQLDTSTNATDDVDDAVDEMFARLKDLESRINTLSSLGENKYEEQRRESEGSYAVDDAVLARFRILKSHADNITSLVLESSKQPRDAGTNMSGEIDDAGAEVCTRLEVLERNLSSLGDNKCEEQQKESKASSSVGDGVLARLQILKSRVDNIIPPALESSKQQLNASMDIADVVDDAVMARLRILKSHPNLEASSIGGDVEGVEDTCAVGLQISSRQPSPSPATVLKQTTLPSATEPLEVTGETPATLILPSIEVPPLSPLKDAPSALEKDHSRLADDALPPAPLFSVPQEAGGSAQKIAKVKRPPHGPTPRSFRIPPTIRIKRPISEQGARAILLGKLGMIKDDEVDEQAMDKCLQILEASFPRSLVQAIFCGSDMVKGGELWGISASDVVF